MAASVEVEEEAECLAEIFGEAFMKNGEREWTVSILPGYTIMLFLPDGYPSTEPPTIALQADFATDQTETEVMEAVVAAHEEAAGEVCCFQIVERTREILSDAELAHERLAALSLADSTESAHHAATVETDSTPTEAAHDEREEQWVFEPESSRYKQPRRTFAVVEPTVAMPEIVHGEIFEDRKSRFQAHAARVRTQREVDWVYQTLLQDKKIARASHNVVYYRYRDPVTNVDCHDNDDDGETGAGSRMAEMMHLMAVADVFVMVSRWYGGIQLGPDRFKHFNNCARNLLETAALVDVSSGNSKKSRSKGK
eukprot:m.450574 g.450574  ORF g.450574 m.450574 type:complete len:311 (-) comp20019_c0_seq1:2804-3736(-)